MVRGPLGYTKDIGNVILTQRATSTPVYMVPDPLHDKPRPPNAKSYQEDKVYICKAAYLNVLSSNPDDSAMGRQRKQVII